MGLFKYWLGMGFCKFSVAVTNWRINHTRTERRFASLGRTMMEELLCVVLMVVMIVFLLIIILPSKKMESQKSQPVATAPAASTYNADSQLIENLKTTIGILQGQNSRLTEINRQTNVQIAGLKKDLEKAQGAIETLATDYKTKLETANRETNIQIQEYQQNIAALEYNIIGLRKDLEKAQTAMKTFAGDYEAKLKTANQKAATDLSAQKTSYEAKLVTLRAERDKIIRELLAAYTYLIEVKAKPNGVQWMESEIARNKQGAETIKPILATGNYVSNRNWELFEQYSRTSKELKALLDGQLKADYDHYKLLVEESRALNEKYSPR